MWLLPLATANNSGAGWLAGFPQAGVGEEAAGSIPRAQEAKRPRVKVVHSYQSRGRTRKGGMHPVQLGAFRRPLDPPLPLLSILTTIRTL